MEKKFDRTAEDLGNVIGLEHINVMVPDQQLATLFYAKGLGLTRDPYLMVELDNMWMNVGRSQFHLPTRPQAQVLRGHTGLVLPDRAAPGARPPLPQTAWVWTNCAIAAADAAVPSFGSPTSLISPSPP